MLEHRFETIYKNNYEALQSFALTLTRNKMDADDLVQDTAIKVFRNFGSYKEHQNFKNWCFTILKNTYFTNYKKRKRRNIVATPIEDLNFLGIIQIETKPSSGRKLILLKEAIEMLSVKSKEPFLMFINGYSYKEISQYLEIPIGTVKSRINFARTKLRRYYQETTTKNFGLN